MIAPASRKRLMAHAGWVGTMVRRLEACAEGHRKRGHEIWAKEFEDAAEALEGSVTPLQIAVAE